MTAKQYAQHLFDKAVTPIMDLPLTDDTIKAIGLGLANVMLSEIMDQNTKQSKHDWIVETYRALNSGDIEY